MPRPETPRQHQEYVLQPKSVSRNHYRTQGPNQARLQPEQRNDMQVTGRLHNKDIPPDQHTQGQLSLAIHNTLQNTFESSHMAGSDVPHHHLYLQPKNYPL